MSTITKEQLLERAREKVKGLEYALKHPVAFADTLTELEEELELARIALASLEAEPVAYVMVDDLKDSSIISTPAYRDLGEAMERTVGDVVALFTAPPAPVSVPDDIDARMKNAGMLSAAEIIAGQPIDAFMKHAGVVDLESLLKWSEMRRAEFLRMQAKYELGDNQKDDMYEWVISHVAVFSELHVNIRAAMLQGADGNSPVIPDGWVACSERMPTKQDGTVFLTWNGQYIGKELFLMGSFQCLKPEIITHWMPLPAAPQQEVKP